MKDQDLYNYFSSRKHTADEMPSPELWNKISSQLPTSTSTGKFWTMGKIGLFLFPIIAASAYWLGINQEIKPPNNNIEQTRLEHVSQQKDSSDQTIVSDKSHFSQQNADLVKEAQNDKQQAFSTPAVSNIHHGTSSDDSKHDDTIRYKVMPVRSQDVLTFQQDTNKVQTFTIEFAKPNAGKPVKAVNLDSLLQRQTKLQPKNHPVMPR